MPKASKRVILVDGENLVMRYQEMLKAGSKPYGDIMHVKDVYVWSPRLVPQEEFSDILRIIYYTYATGADETIFEINRKLQQIEYETKVDAVGGVSAIGRVMYFTQQGFIVPKVFKKLSRSAKSKGVDISICIDMLNYSLIDSISEIMLITGDGDFIPLIREAMHKGKRIMVRALSSGLNKDLTIVADEFRCIDGLFFETNGGVSKD